MTATEIVRSWKDASFRARHTGVPDNPAGVRELDAAELEQLVGGSLTDFVAAGTAPPVTTKMLCCGDSNYSFRYDICC